MTVSVITVCFNEECTIERTIQSVLSQDTNDFEYIICDGGSTDSTLYIIEKYKAEFQKKGIYLSITSEKDGGPYFGMNKGTSKARGSYTIFMNGGDTFADNSVLTNLINCINALENKPTVIYGDTDLIAEDCVQRIVNDHNKLEKEMINHQSLLVNTEELKKHPFNTDYKYSADYECILSLYLEKKEYLKVPFIIANFYSGGISSKHHIKVIKERLLIWDKYGIEYSKNMCIMKAWMVGIYMKLRDKFPKLAIGLYNRKAR